MFLSFRQQLQTNALLKQGFAKKPKNSNSKQSARTTGMLFVCILIMSLMIVKVSSTTAYYQNQTAANSIQSIENHNFTNKLQANKLIGQKFDTSLQNLSFIKNMQQSNAKIADNLKSHKYREDIMEPHAISVQSPKPQQRQMHSRVSENAYLLEHGNAKANEQPIYGTWRMKARRPPLPIKAAPGSMAASAALSVSDEKLPEAAESEDFRPKHVYERLPRRMSTMLPIRGELPEQIPRPPQLTSRRPSFIVRRQFLETPLNGSYNEEHKPKPFHFPYDGPMPERFKKLESERNEINNIQDILQQLHLSGAQPPVPPMMMMPTGLHIAGTFKNLKSSGIQNFFRSKRNKKHIQHMLPIPMALPLYGPYQGPMYGPMHTPHQRIAMDQFYPFKPRSPNDINLLAMQQQLKSNRIKNKKKSKKVLLNNNNLLLQHGGNSHIPMESYAPIYPQYVAVNITQKPKLKRLPFKVNLDIFPVMPPVRDAKTSVFTLDEAKVAGISRPSSVMRHPYADINPYGAVYGTQYENFAFKPVKYETHMEHQTPQASNMHFTHPVQQQKQHKEQKPPPKQLLRVPSQHQKQHQYLNAHNGFQPIDCAHQASSSNIITNEANQKVNRPIMVHLNVFPKSQKIPNVSTPLPSTNPFYNQASSISRSQMYDESELQPFELQQQKLVKPLQNNSYTLVQMHAQRPQERIDNQQDMQPLIDFEHPIVAAEVTTQEPEPTSALTSNKLDAPESMPNYNNSDRPTTRSQQYNMNATDHVEQTSNDTQSVSMFRFPVENLIQFQVDDAL